MKSDVLGRRARFNRQPKRTQAGTEKRVEIQTRDIELFRLLIRYRYLPSHFIWRLLPADHRGTCYARYLERLCLLYHHGYLHRPERQRLAVNARSRNLVYELDTGAKQVLRELGFSLRHRVGYGRNFHHELMVCLIAASFEVACREHPDLELIAWPELIADERVPEATRSSSRPFQIPVTITHQGVRKKIRLCPDGWPMVIRHRPTRAVLCIPGFEADRAQEPEEPLNIFERSNITVKLLAYLAMADSCIHRTHFGFPNMIVPVVTTTTKRLRNMMRLLAKLTGGKGSSFILFKALPDLTGYDSNPQPTPAFLLEPWQRVGHEPFDVAQVLSAPLNRAVACIRLGAAG